MLHNLSSSGSKLHGKSWPAALAYISLGMIWGSNFIYMKLAAAHISPMQIVFFRVLFGFIPVCIYSVATRAIQPGHFKHGFHFFVMSLLATSVYYYGYARGTALLHSGVAGALAGSIPLFSFLLGIILLPEEKNALTRSKLAGMASGLLGVLIIGRPSGDQLLDSNLDGVVSMVVGSLSVGASFVYAKRYIVPLRLPTAALTTYQLGFGLLSLLLVTDFNGMDNITHSLHASLGLVIGLGLLGTGIAYLIYYFLVARMGAVTASSVTYLPPLVALFIGAVLVGEPIEGLDYLAALLIGLGVALLKK